ncbi:iron ABC transporter permease [Candidatus Amarobacter glycogenicus]|uniref:ABC transporter permease n=1 Tax=Candidatus Amarobacter glycogenicus TaxID=3140699 RepID=UPI003136A226|nr:iron ABC transporter permease [Dehalococcoidia bacterium]
MDRSVDEKRPSLTARARERRPLLLVVPAGLLLAAFLAYPLQGILRESFQRDGGIGLLVEDTYYLERGWFTLWQATVSAALTLLLAVPLAWLLACHAFPGKRTIEAVLMVPFVLPTIVVAVAFSALIGPSGVANDLLTRIPGIDEPPIRILNTVWAILLAHVFYNVAVAGRIIATGWRGLDSRVEESAAMLGAGPAARFFLVTLPALRNSLLAAASLVFLFCFTSFGVVLILGGPQFGTLETEIYRESLFLFRLPVAGALALAQLVVTFAAIVINARLQQATPQRTEARSTTPWDRKSAALGAAILALLLLLTAAPMAALVERSFHGGDGYTLRYYTMLDDNIRGQALFVAPIEAVRNSVVFAIATVAVALPIGTLAAIGSVRARSTLAEALVQLPLGVSSVTLGLGFLVTMDQPPLNLRESPALVVIAHSLIAVPFVTRTVSARLRSLDPRLRDAAAMLGAGPARTFFAVEAPLLKGAIGVAAVLSFATSMGEFGATLLIARPEYPTIPVAIFRYLGQPGALNYGQALAMSTVLMAVTGSTFFLAERLVRVRTGGVS